MKIVFCLWPERGHVNPFIGPAQALQDLGHDVLIGSIGDISEQIERSGLKFSRDLLSPHAAGAPKGKALVDIIENPPLHRQMLEEFIMHGIAPNVAPMKAWFEKEAPDAAVIDPMNYPAVIAAQLLGIPWVQISSSLTSVLPDSLKSATRSLVNEMSPHREAIFRQFGEIPKFRAVDTLSPLLNITFATEAFVGRPPSEVKLVGPSLPLHQRGDEVPMIPIADDRPLIYISFGSQVFHYPEIFKKLIAATRALSVRLILSVGDLIDQPGFESTEDVQFYRYAPQLKVLEKAALFITHGGANSVMEGLRAGVPLLISPICNDQEHQAFFVEQSGVGRALNLKYAGVDEIRTALQELLNDRQVKATVKKVSATYQENGAPKAAKLILKALESKRVPETGQITA